MHVPADSSKCPVLGKKRMALTPLLCPCHVWIQRLGRYVLSASLRLSRGGAIHERPCRKCRRQTCRAKCQCTPDVFKGALPTADCAGAQPSPVACRLVLY